MGALERTTLLPGIVGSRGPREGGSGTHTTRPRLPCPAVSEGRMGCGLDQPCAGVGVEGGMSTEQGWEGWSPG